jgi:hypothetical protein
MNAALSTLVNARKNEPHADAKKLLFFVAVAGLGLSA